MHRLFPIQHQKIFLYIRKPDSRNSTRKPIAFSTPFCSLLPMAIPAKSSNPLLLLSVLLCFTQVIIAGRQFPAPSDMERPQALGQEGSASIPGIGRYMFGSYPQLPGLGDLDHSGPAAANARYIPGFDDTFVPNPGFEIPNPFRGSNP